MVGGSSTQSEAVRKACLGDTSSIKSDLHGYRPPFWAQVVILDRSDSNASI